MEAAQLAFLLYSGRDDITQSIRKHSLRFNPLYSLFLTVHSLPFYSLKLFPGEWEFLIWSKLPGYPC